MVGNNEYIIPIKGLKRGKHEFDFDIKKGSVDGIEGDIDMKLTLGIDKKETFYQFFFDFKGWIELECDNCLNHYKEQIDAQHEMIVKHSHDEGTYEEGEVEMKFISMEESQLDLNSDIYEYIMVNLPMKKVCVNGNCDTAVLDILNKKEEVKDTDDVDPRWEALKNLKNDLNK